jgi:molybdopterin-guanine dinucleotide biosynthesis protein A
VITVGIFVGGRATRMGGKAKGLLPLPGPTTIVERTMAVIRRQGAQAVLVGRSDAYALGVPSLPDAESDVGPLGGLLSLLEYADPGLAIALACDMPYITDGLLGRLVTHVSSAPVVAPRREGRWEPLFARYDPPRCIDAARARLLRRELSLQGLLDEVGAGELPLLPGDDPLLVDWDRPEDVR